MCQRSRNCWESNKRPGRQQSVVEQRAGRVTASEFKAACSTNPDKPSKSLIKLICYPGAHRFSNAATKWGISNESKAREAYQFSIADQLLNLSVADSGLHISENWPFLGASPDGLVFCECCGRGLCEIKCPYKYKDGMLVNYCCSRQQFLSEIWWQWGWFVLGYCSSLLLLSAVPVVCNWSGVLWFRCLDYKGHVCSASVAWHWVLGQSVDKGNTLLQERSSPRDFRTMVHTF